MKKKKKIEKRKNKIFSFNASLLRKLTRRNIILQCDKALASIIMKIRKNLNTHCRILW